MLDNLSHRLYGTEHAAQDQGHLGVHHGEAHGGAVLPPAHGGEVFAAPVDHAAPEGEDGHPDHEVDRKVEGPGQPVDDKVYAHIAPLVDAGAGADERDVDHDIAGELLRPVGVLDAGGQPGHHLDEYDRGHHDHHRHAEDPHEMIDECQKF